MKKKILAMLLVVCMVASMVPAAFAAGTFTDVPAGEWYAEEVEYVYANGLMGGVGEGRFSPNGDVSRAMVWTTLARLAGENTAGSEPWWLAGQQWMMATGISDGTGAEKAITREQLATMLWRYAKFMGYDVSVGERASIHSYSDAFSVSEWAVEAMQWVCGAGIINGINGALQPQKGATRAQLAVILYRFVEGVVKAEPVTPVPTPTPTPTPGYVHSCYVSQWTANNDGTHSGTCTCGAVYKENCVTENAVCVKCGAVIAATAEDLAIALAADLDVYLTADIVLPDNWILAGDGTRDGSNYTGDAYTGTFNGNGHTITNVKNGLFGIVDGGTVKNVKLVATIDSSADSVGAAVAILCGGGIVDGVEVSGTVKGVEGVGGVVGRILAEGTVTNCTNSAAVTQTGDSDSAGGIVGKAYYTKSGKEMNISNCTNIGAVVSDYAAGGIVGFSAANVTDCINSGVVTSGFEAGGIIGEQTNYGEVSDNTNTANITAVGKAGGIIGWIRYQNSEANYPNNEVVTVTGNTNSGTVAATGDVSAQASAGGIVGLAYKQAVVTGNTNSAESISAGTFAAGIVGAIQEGDGLTIGDGKFVVTNNATTTTIENITANCKDLYVYNNDPNNPDFATVEGNGEAFVAEVNGVSYTSLQDAVAAVQNGETIVILPGAYTEVLDVRSGKTFTVKAEEAGTVVIAGINQQTNGDSASTVTFENLTIDNSKATEGWFTGTAQNIFPCVGAWGGNLTFNNCTFEVAGTSKKETGVMTWWTTNKVTLSFNKCTFNGIDNHASARAMQIYGNVDMTVTNCEFNTYKDYTLKYVAQEGCTATLSGNTVNNSENFVELGSAPYAGSKYTVYLNSNTLGNGVSNYVIANDEDQTVVIDGKIPVAEGFAIDPESGAYEISSAAGLFNFAKQVNVEGNNFSGKTVKLTANIDLNNAAWTPIGQTGATEFRGVFDGQNYTISNLSIDSSAQTSAHYSSGLFGWSEAGAQIKNVKIDGATVKGNHNVAVIVGYTYSNTISNCHVSNATIICTHANDNACGDKAGIIGGYVGDEARVSNCSATDCTVTAGRDGGQLIGAGYNGSVSGCTATNVTVTAGGDCTGANINVALIGRVLG